MTDSRNSLPESLKEIEVDLVVQQLSSITTKGLSELPERLLCLIDSPFDEIALEIARILAGNKHEIRLRRFASPSTSFRDVLTVASVPSVTKIPVTSGPGEYSVKIRPRRKSIVLWEDNITIVDDMTCVLHGFERMCLPAAEPLSRKFEELDIGDLVEGICEWRTSLLQRRARDTVVYNLAKPRQPISAKGSMAQLGLEIEAVLAYAESFVFFDGTINVTLSVVGQGYLEIDVNAQSRHHFQLRTELENFMLRSSPDLKLGRATVEPKHNAVNLTYRYPRSSCGPEFRSNT